MLFVKRTLRRKHEDILYNFLPSTFGRRLKTYLFLSSGGQCSATDPAGGAYSAPLAA